MLKAVLTSLIFAKLESFQTSERLLSECFHEVDERLLVVLFTEDLMQSEFLHCITILPHCLE